MNPTVLAVVAVVSVLSNGAPAAMRRLENTVDVYVCSSSIVPMAVEARARARAAKAFAEVDIAVKFHAGDPPRHPGGQPIIVRLIESTPDRHPGALAYAWVFEGKHVDVMYDRLRRDTPSMTAAILAYVLVHEITHILEGVDRHSLTGIMKAHWDPADEVAMRQGRFHFQQGEAEYIDAGLRVRHGL